MLKTTITPMSWSNFKIFKDPTFRHAFFILLISYMYPHLGLFSFKSIGLENLDDTWIVISGIVGSITDALSRLVIGSCFKRFGFIACAIFITFV